MTWNVQTINKQWEFLRKYYDVLFNSGEQTCASDSVYGTKLQFVPDKWGCFATQFMSINPMIGSRSDANVTCYRNILIEFDTLSYAEQDALGTNIPYSTKVFSGNKSIHFIISLEQPLVNRSEYDRLVDRIYAKLPDCDKSTRNPSRFTRVPEVVRTGGSMQTLLDVRRRITREELEDWLGPEPEKPICPIVKNYEGREIKLQNRFVRHFLLNGADPGQRNQELYKNACEMLRSGFTEEEILELVMPVLDLEIREMKTCIRSAAKKVRNGL